LGSISGGKFIDGLRNYILFEISLSVQREIQYEDFGSE
jgi:hypothetical protein